MHETAPGYPLKAVKLSPSQSFICRTGFRRSDLRSRTLHACEMCAVFIKMGLCPNRQYRTVMNGRALGSQVADLIEAHSTLAFKW